MKHSALAVLLIVAWRGMLSAHPIDETKLVDLTYPFDEHTIYWPTSKPFQLEVVSAQKTPAGYWYAANNICLAEHGGTHMDAPIHFAEGKRAADEVPIQQLIGPAVVIDVRIQAQKDPDYRVSVADLEVWEKKNGRMPQGAIVLMFSGWGARWPDKKTYLGTDQRGDVVNLHFPGFSKEAAEFLVSQRAIDAIGVDTPSIDYGQSHDFIVHRIINGANKPGLENVAHLDKLPAKGATVIALPMKIAKGSGGPVRIIAVLP
ncbi:MAG TPA: cyclase family protein [Methylomirabilota bacterium]|jgi:kynurenine formamidase|nr:cyclase family protein [Methylomirabilota bacterium]